MKLVRYGQPGRELPGVIDAEGNIRSLSSLVHDIVGRALSDQMIDAFRFQDPSTLRVVTNDVRLGPCVGGVGKFICVGLNYKDHAEEAGMDIPKEPILFMKATSALCGPNDDVWLPPGSTKGDWEVELGVVIGKAGTRIAERDALSHVAGYCIVNDLSERSFQLECGGQWVKGKSCDTFGPIGPWLVTRDQVPDPQNLTLWLDVNGERMQSGSTRTMLFSVAELVSYISRFMTLHPGDIISTGTPPGVGMGQKPDPIYLKAADQMSLGIQGLGEQHQTVFQHKK